MKESTPADDFDPTMDAHDLHVFMAENYPSSSDMRTEENIYKWGFSIVILILLIGGSLLVWAHWLR